MYSMYIFSGFSKRKSIDALHLRRGPTFYRYLKGEYTTTKARHDARVITKSDVKKYEKMPLPVEHVSERHK